MRVLVADDSDLLVERLLAALSRVQNVEIVGRAANAGEASEAIRRLNPEVVILDLCMPGGSGLDVLKDLQRDQMRPLVIVLTGYGESQYRKRCMELGATFFFAKTTEFEKVAEVLREMVAGKAQRGFPLSDAPTPGQAMKELYPSFQEHVRQEHEDAGDPPAVPSAHDGRELFDLPSTGAGCGPGMDAGKAN